METSTVRNRLAALTVTAAEHDVLHKRAGEEGRSVSGFLRVRLRDVLSTDEGHPNDSVVSARIDMQEVFANGNGGEIITTMTGDEAA